MNKKVAKNKKSVCGRKGSKTTSYRLKCKKTANGLSHYVMYGDADKKTALL